MADETRLARLKTGERCAVVAHLSEALERRRMLELGLTEGTEIEVLLRSPSKDPTSYAFRGTVVAIRSENAEKILVRKFAAEVL